MEANPMGRRHYGSHAGESVKAGNDPATALWRGSLEGLGAFSRAIEIAWTRAAGPAAVAARAAQRAAELVAFARARSPFYRDAWRDVPPRETSLATLPTVCKRDLMARFDDWVTDRRVTRQGIEAFLDDRTHVGEQYLGRYVVWKSSGSTGEPGVFVQDAAAMSMYDALLAVQFQSPALAGRYALGFFTKGGRAALVAATGDHFASIASWQRVCRGSPWPNARAFSVMDPLPELVAALNRYQPAFLASYPTTLALLAAEQRAGRLRITPACIWSGGECFAAAMAAAIERAFDSVVINEYGASECLSIAVSCRHRWLHVNADWVVLEAVDRDHRPTPPGEPSHTVLLTNLANRVQPVIRYDLGDSVIVNPAPCACGSPLPAIRAEGRRDDIVALKTADGHVVRLSPLALTTVVEDALPGHRFQLVQSAPDCIRVRLAIDAPEERAVAFEATRCALAAYLARQGAANARLDLDASPPLTDPRSGKLREVIADVHGA
jgi:phenylacetate-coenzyme A ligase PaaK-like adenylate-forming protein